MRHTFRQWREYYGLWWETEFRLVLARELEVSSLNLLPDIEILYGPRTLALSVYAGRSAGKLRSILRAQDMALARHTIPWKVDESPWIGWAGSRLLIELGWPDALSDKQVKTANLLRGKEVRCIRKGDAWIVGVDARYKTVMLSTDPARGGPHTLVSGETQSGKTFAMRSALLQLSICEDNIFVLICVSQKDSFRPLRNMNNLVFPIADNLDESRYVLNWVYEQIGPRLENGAIGKLIVAIDELQTLKDDKECTSLVRALTSEGAEAGVNVIGATQRPVVGELGPMGGIIKANMAQRIALRVPDIQASTIALGVSGAEGRLNTLRGQGDAMINNPYIPPTRVQVAYYDDEEVRQRMSEDVGPMNQFGDLAIPQSEDKCFSADQIAVAMILKEGADLSGSQFGFGRTRLMKYLVDMGEPLTDNAAKRLMTMAARITKIIRKHGRLKRPLYA